MQIENHQNFYYVKLITLCNEEPDLRNKLLNVLEQTEFNKNRIRENGSFLHILVFYLLHLKIEKCIEEEDTPNNFNKAISYHLQDIKFWQNLQRFFIDERLILNTEHTKIFKLLKKRIPKIHELVLELPADERNLHLLISYISKKIGSDKKAPFEKYSEMVTINGEFKIDKYPVTNERFLEFLNHLKRSNNKELIDKYIMPAYSKIIKEENYEVKIVPGYENHPVTGVTWQAAMEFAKHHRKTLPNVDQWQKAFGNKQYPYGNEFDSEKCNTLESKLMNTTPVDQYPDGVSSYGVFDMSGNVWEWCFDSCEDENNRKIIGGSWANQGKDATKDKSQCRSKDRGFENIGFRCISILQK